ncbi:uncharacterized protein IL334_000041 [Kwoniella shivajii]|uniref:Uncharacterized protein n=1 Tax=Kwoniella shivajii TaxID=564305 RepID=A0ABZ1CN70_9TREE|nr:hypothetical protein IL334_000041 [Kwoniella shivajii]
MTSTDTSASTFSQSTTKKKKPRCRLRHILRDIQTEIMALESYLPATTRDGLSTLYDVTENLLKERRRTNELTKNRKYLFKRLSLSEDCSIRSIRKDFETERKERGFSRPARETKNRDLFQDWLTTSIEDKVNWTKDSWGEQIGKLTDEIEHTQLTNTTLRDDIETLKSVLEVSKSTYSKLDIGPSTTNHDYPLPASDMTPITFTDSEDPVCTRRHNHASSDPSSGPASGSNRSRIPSDTSSLEGILSSVAHTPKEVFSHRYETTDSRDLG